MEKQPAHQPVGRQDHEFVARLQALALHVGRGGDQAARLLEVGVAKRAAGWGGMGQVTGSNLC
jgi:hypothetical protein